MEAMFLSNMSHLQAASQNEANIPLMEKISIIMIPGVKTSSMKEKIQETQ